MNISNLGYKYDKPSVEKRSTDVTAKASAKLSLGGTLAHLANATWNSLKGIGTSEAVTITWSANEYDLTASIAN